MSVTKEQPQEAEVVQHHEGHDHESRLNVEQELHIHAKTIIAVAVSKIRAYLIYWPHSTDSWTQAVAFNIMAQVMAVVGSGLLAQGTTTLLGDVSKAVWCSTALVIGTVALNPPLSQAADYWGRRWPIILLSATGVVGCIVASRAQSLTTLLAGFALIGTATGCQSLLYTVPSESLPRKHRAIGQAVVNVASATSGMVGILMGGALLRYNHLENYRIYWYVTAGIWALGTVGILIGYNPPRRELQSLTQLEKLRKIDWIGISLLITGLVLFCIALQWSGNPYSWRNAHVLATFIVGVVLILGFLVYEWRFKHDGILHHGLFRDRNFIVAIVAIFMEGLTFFTANSYFVFEISLLQDLDLFEAGLRFVVLFISMTTFAFIVALYTTWTKQVREPLVAAFALIAIFEGLMITMKPSTPLSRPWGYAVLGGAGLGFLLTNVYVGAQLSTPPELISLTTGLMTASRSFGGAIGLAINNAVFRNTLSSNLGSKIAAAVSPLGFPAQELPELIPALLSGNPSVLAKLPHITPQIIVAGVQGLKEAYTAAFHNAWIVGTSFAAVGVIGQYPISSPTTIWANVSTKASCFFRNPKSEFNAHIDAPAEEELVRLQKEIEAAGATYKYHNG